MKTRIGLWLSLLLVMCTGSVHRRGEAGHQPDHQFIAIRTPIRGHPML